MIEYIKMGFGFTAGFLLFLIFIFVLAFVFVVIGCLIHGLFHRVRLKRLAKNIDIDKLKSNGIPDK